ncbi:hypothetical protein [Parasediminibacterium sp. JCM 36343]|uniref:hypothetical protein n=1 Tax=Parasediminibacterium sp. JCM 36343 TaxID=3374279 RepID=UPI00397DE6AB
MRWLIFPLILVCTNMAAQCKTFRLNADGDTLDCVDKNNKKQGKWVIKTPSLHGEQGYDEEGEFVDGKREGPWRKYNLMGDFIAVENYRWGYKDGVSQYFNIYGLEHEETWRAINPQYPYDTVLVPDVTNPDKYELKVVKVEGGTVKNGNWRYYNPETGMIVKTEFYWLDKLQDQSGANGQSQGTKLSASTGSSKPKEVQQFEKKIANKRKVKIRDGSTSF